MRNSRRAAAFAFAKWLSSGDFAPGLLPQGPDRPFVQDMLYCAVRRMHPLREALGRFAKKWPKGEMEALLYIGAAQILYMDGVPDFAAVNETVEAAKECGNPSVARTVNAILRNVVRSKDEILSSLASAPFEVRESLPTALARRWEKRFGAEAAEKMAELFNKPAETFAVSRDGEYRVVPHGRRVEDEPGYAEGGFIVQDPATRHAVELVAAKPGERILDACAAPGGKTVRLCWAGADVVACEVNPRRRRRLEENLARTRVQAKVVPSLDLAETFDKVLADVPCSNTGVIRRKPDVRWNWSEEKTAGLVAVQREILDKCAALVEPGGRLVYSTCSLEPEENSLQVRSFLERHPGFSLAAERESLPFETGNDGAYAAALERARR